MKNLLDLTGRTIVITGASQGIGRAVSDLCLDLGAQVALLDLQEEPLREYVDQIGADRAVGVAGSVTDRAKVDELVAAAVAKFGRIDGLVNNAGITRTAMALKMTIEQWQQVIDVHLTGSFHCIQAVGAQMVAQYEKDQIGGAIVNISSDAGRRGTIGQINYGTAKAGTLGMTMSAAQEWARYGIRVNTVAFGVVETPMTEVIRSDKFRDKSLAKIPLGRFGSAEEVAPPIAFLLSDAASYISGQHLSVSGGAFMAS
ncbi:MULTISPECIES: SDR family NAD(P)-dependent oxidoreductase [unclassified Sphingobium]|uniref:SDR family NAD(P)-dependent oxidoreductase n=1 Tax=unclassified Sphingobium TaxID=2611147 RepID=UPI000D17529D|nr:MULTISPECIES: SDR family NAD(P)-dependent oxidoreductase [unclassified Sphingobium]MBG6120072.1 3-oxoacyl-[acyl-carrier protein] reductase [Sphingobium sp. JAI105]PSO13102.1 3-oxoacyl-ACP reductase [Sphingobium sp. AEW4]TWD05727.1 3-oxoacyl-[acyl-carrier protein] reductase [Sphingobium sp. AEW010]TWD23280.1 3-oxoacyl-[acyl-carrier protein] reductase [Sphingobium sp. AEW013]TWD25140.1 3-oxoacyl-[acyl-carrier protein] reductase [Sphingobium sp. AEW001]